MNLDKKNILHLANLAKLQLSDLEVATFSRQLTDILAFVAKIKKLDLAKVKESLSGIDQKDCLPPRPDIVEASSFKIENNFIVVPHVFENDKK